MFFYAGNRRKSGSFVGVCGLVILFLLAACVDKGKDNLPGDSESAGVQDIEEQDSTDSESVETVDGDDAEAPEPGFLFDAPGPFSTGYRTSTVTYESPAGGGPRTLDLHLWYPSQDTEGANPSYEKFFVDEESFVDAELAPPEGEHYPLFVFSHGHRGFAGNSAFLMRHFASHGWVAVAPDHKGNTISDNIDPRPLSIYYLRSLDISAVLDALTGLDDGDPLSGKLAVDEVILAGHSFGVHTTWASAGAVFDMDALEARCDATPDRVGCGTEGLEVFEGGLGDERIVGIIPMAGSINSDFFGAEGHKVVTIPILSMSGGEDPVGADLQFEKSTGLDLTWIELEGGCHQTFAIGACGTLEDDLGFQIVGAYAMAFARHYLLDDQSLEVLGLLDGSIVLSDKVVLRRVR